MNILIYKQTKGKHSRQTSQVLRYCLQLDHVTLPNNLSHAVFLTCRHLTCQCQPSSFVLPQQQRCSQLECLRHRKLCNLHKPHKHSSHSAQCCIMYLIRTASQSPSSVQLHNLPHLYSCTIYLICTAAQSSLSVQPCTLPHLYSQFTSSVQLQNPPHLHNLNLKFTSSVQQHNLPHIYSYTIHLICRARQFTSQYSRTIFLVRTTTQSTFSIQPHNLPFLYTIYLICTATQSISSVQPHNLPHLLSHTIYLICSAIQSTSSVQFIYLISTATQSSSPVQPHNLPHMQSHTIYLLCTATQSTFSVHNHPHLFSHTIYLISSTTQSTSSVQPHNLPNLFYQNQNPNPNIYCPNASSAIQSASSVQPHNLPHLHKKQKASLHSAQCCIFDLCCAVFTIYCLSRNVSYSPIGSSGPSHSNWNKSTLHRPIHILTVTCAPGIHFRFIFFSPLPEIKDAERPSSSDRLQVNEYKALVSVMSASTARRMLKKNNETGIVSYHTCTNLAAYITCKHNANLNLSAKQSSYTKLMKYFVTLQFTQVKSDPFLVYIYHTD